MEHRAGAANKGIKIAFGLTLALFISELVGGYWANSLALISDAWHLLSDLLALGVSWFALQQAQKPANQLMTYGYHRLGIFAALINNLTLIGISIYIFISAGIRMIKPEQVHSGGMIVLAAIGFVVTFIIVMILKRGEQNLNTKSALLHFFGDVLSYAGVMIGGVIISYTGWMWVDPVLSIGFGMIIMVGAWKMLKEASLILLQAVPKMVNIDKVEKDLLQMDGVVAIRDLHVWSLTSEKVLLSVHVTTSLQQIGEIEALLHRIQHNLSQHGIHHSTVQFESSVCGSCPKQWHGAPTDMSELCIHSCPSYS